MQEIINYTADFLGIDPEKINKNTKLQEELGLSSFDLMELSCELEERFKVKINTEDLANIKSIEDLRSIMAVEG